MESNSNDHDQKRAAKSSSTDHESILSLTVFIIYAHIGARLDAVPELHCERGENARARGDVRGETAPI